MKQPNLNTQRLLLRPLSLADSAKIQELAGNWAVAKTTLSIPHPYRYGMAEKWILSLEGAWNTRSGLAFGVLLKTDQEIIGVVSLVSISDKKAELGYWIGEQYWGKGYCTEATEALMRLASKQLQITNFVAEHLTENPASGKVMLKLGMVHLHSVERTDRNGKLAQIETYGSNHT
ncbi:GNAT family N-acetyltransferase [Gammaproteobacteria bacterium AH-315-C21]|nr:GNAT family N-acetyltransferase [Gammaproteobacteria bacterium AH-315-C21]